MTGPLHPAFGARFGCCLGPRESELGGGESGSRNCFGNAPGRIPPTGADSVSHSPSFSWPGSILLRHLSSGVPLPLERGLKSSAKGKSSSAAIFLTKCKQRLDIRPTTVRHLIRAIVPPRPERSLRSMAGNRLMLNETFAMHSVHTELGISSPKMTHLLS